MGAALAACAGLPAIEGEQLPKDTSSAGPIVYRDLADIPEAPPVSRPQANQAAIESLMMDRAKTAETAQDLRRQPFNMPDPSTPLGF
jgi:type IV pilus biogenesis protein CpaD/CtpE